MKAVGDTIGVRVCLSVAREESFSSRGGMTFTPLPSTVSWNPSRNSESEKINLIGYLTPYLNPLDRFVE
jgi:hypothetical protein